MKQYKTSTKILVCILPFVLAFVLYFVALYVSRHITFPECTFHRITGLYCPSCGMTRSVKALLNGNVLLSLRQNAAIVFMAVCFLFMYPELVFKVFGKNLRSPIRNNIFLFVSIGVFAAYFVIRNFVPEIAPI